MTAEQLYLGLLAACIGLPALTVAAIAANAAWRRMFTSDYVGIATRHRGEGGYLTARAILFAVALSAVVWLLIFAAVDAVFGVFR